jgi:hypothetical protein
VYNLFTDCRQSKSNPEIRRRLMNVLGIIIVAILLLAAIVIVATKLVGDYVAAIGMNNAGGISAEDVETCLADLAEESCGVCGNLFDEGRHRSGDSGICLSCIAKNGGECLDPN